jgi:uncharacterized membrane protein
MLHLPKFNFSHLLHGADDRAWQSFFQSDILHCIAVSLLIMQVLLLVLRSERLLYLTVGVLAVVVVGVTPVMWSIDFQKFLPVPFAAYMNGLHFSLFPLFPWSAFLCAGAVTGFYYQRAREAVSPERQGNELRMMNFVVLAGVTVIGISFLIEPIAAAEYPVYDYWRFSPSFVLLRLGLVLLLCAGMFLYERFHGVASSSAVTLIGRESLLVYATHLLLIYGNFGSFNFHDRVNHSYGYPQALVAILILWIAMYALAYVWDYIKRGSPMLKVAVNLGTLASFLGVFFFGPGQ